MKWFWMAYAIAMIIVDGVVTQGAWGYATELNPLLASIRAMWMVKACAIVAVPLMYKLLEKADHDLIAELGTVYFATLMALVNVSNSIVVFAASSN